MGANSDGDGRTSFEKTSDREMVMTRLFDGPPRIVFDAWTRPDLFKRWWAPRSMGVPIFACEMDVRTGGGYRLEFGHDAADTHAFYGKYLDVVPNERLVWTNDENGGSESQITTVTFEDQDGKTLLRVHERFPTTEELDEAFEGMGATTEEQYAQLDELLVELGASA